MLKLMLKLNILIIKKLFGVSRLFPIFFVIVKLCAKLCVKSCSNFQTYSQIGDILFHLYDYFLG